MYVDWEVHMSIYHYVLWYLYTLYAMSLQSNRKLDSTIWMFAQTIFCLLVAVVIVVGVNCLWLTIQYARCMIIWISDFDWCMESIFNIWIRKKWNKNCMTVSDQHFANGATVNDKKKKTTKKKYLNWNSNSFVFCGHLCSYENFDSTL